MDENSIKLLLRARLERSKIDKGKRTLSKQDEIALNTLINRTSFNIKPIEEYDEKGSD